MLPATQRRLVGWMLLLGWLPLARGRLWPLLALLFGPGLLMFVVLLWVILVFRWPVLRGAGQRGSCEKQ